MAREIGKRFGLMLAGAGLALAAGLGRAAAQQELRIGFIAPVTGFLSQTGKDMIHGFQMYLDDHHGMLGGAKVDFIIADNQGKPDQAVTMAKKLVLENHVDMFIGGVLASTGYALRRRCRPRRRRSTSLLSPWPTIRLSVSSLANIPILSAVRGRVAARPSARPMGSATKATRKS